MGITANYGLRYPEPNDPFSSAGIQHLAEDVDAALDQYKMSESIVLSPSNGFIALSSGGLFTVNKTRRSVTFNAEFRRPTAVTTPVTLCGTLPVAYRPMENVYDIIFRVGSLDSGFGTIGGISISTDGLISIERMQARSTTPGYAANISWITAS